MKKIRFKVSPTPFLTKDGRPAYGATVQSNGTVNEDALYGKVSQKIGMPAELVKSTFNLAIGQIKTELRNGMRVELPQLSAYLTLPGNFASLRLRLAGRPAGGRCPARGAPLGERRVQELLRRR